MPKPKQYEIPRDKLEALVAQQMPLPKIAESFGCSLKVIRHRIEEYGIERNRLATAGQRRIPVTKEHLQREYVENGRTLDDVANELNCSRKTVADRIREFGLQVRKPSEYERYVDITGNKYGRLTVIRFGGYSHRKPAWFVMCDCGNVLRVIGESMKSGNTQSCGCLGEEWIRRKFVGSMPITVWSKILKNAEVRRIPVTISPEYAWAVFEKQLGICPFTGVQLILSLRKRNASLDRIDSSRPYEEGNVQWIFTPINIMKQRLTDEQLIKFCQMVVEYQDAKKSAAAEQGRKRVVLQKITPFLPPPG